MGDYATYKGEQIKIGTAGDMYYLRPEQIDMIELDKPITWENCRFRFPFPDEDNIEPGAFDDHDKGLAISDFAFPEGVSHGSMQFKSTGYRASTGVLLMAPCPFGVDGKALAAATVVKVRYGFNGFPGQARLIQQRPWQGVWVPVLTCNACGEAFRLPTRADADALLTALDRMAISWARDNENYAVKLRTIADRIEIGYQTPAVFN